jgi:multimeric flavodoxin WrbA
MGKKILVLAASGRKGGNSDILSGEFIKGAEEAGHGTELIYIRDKKVNGCLGCLICQQNGGTCVQKDDMKRYTIKWRYLMLSRWHRRYTFIPSTPR